MARINEFVKRDQLRKLIADAIQEDLNDRGLTEDDIQWVYFMVSPGLDEVFAWVNINPNDIDKLSFDGWQLEYTENIEQAIEIAEFYFDLR